MSGLFFLDEIDEFDLDIISEMILKNVSACIQYINQGGPGKADLLSILNLDRTKFRITVRDGTKRKSDLFVPRYKFELKGPANYCFEANFAQIYSEHAADHFYLTSGSITFARKYRFANLDTLGMLN